MKYCESCNKAFDPEEQSCPICGDDLVNEADDDDTAETIATMMFLGLL